jgi:pimeloyl-ACP methyl ester carboxylesterase
LFDAVGPVADPVRALHDAVTTTSYAAVRGVAGLTGAAVAVGVRLANRPEPRRLDRSVWGSAAVAGVNGILGTRIAESNHDLDLGMTLRLGGQDLPVDAEALAAAYPAAGPHLVLLLPGLCETEHAWRYRRSRDTPADPDYGQRLAADLGASPLYLRYNTGLPLATNGERLSRLLGEVLAAWPVPVRRIDLIGHSMGGLVVRHACLSGVEAGSTWPDLVSNVVYLGSPHTGASLARGAGVLADLLSRRPASRGWGELIDLPGSGVYDLRLGVPSTLAPLPGAAHHSVIAELIASEHNVVGRFLGDLLVSRGSGRMSVGDSVRIAPAHHFDLLNHPEVYRALDTWLST